MKPQILSTIGDIALALGDGFKLYVQVILGILLQASSVESDKVRGGEEGEREGGGRGGERERGGREKERERGGREKERERGGGEREREREREREKMRDSHSYNPANFDGFYHFVIIFCLL